MVECECAVESPVRASAMEIRRDNALRSVYPIEPETLVEFARGIPGFEQIAQYRIHGLDAVRPFMFMEAVRSENVSFVCIDAFVVTRDYSVRLPAAVTERLGLDSEDDAVVLCLVTIGDTVQSTTANLMCPLVINRRNRRGEQVILDGSDLPVRYAIWQALQPTVGATVRP